MRKNIWFYLCIIQVMIIIGMIVVSLCKTFSTPKIKNTNIQEFLDQVEKSNYLPENGYIPDAKTAEIIGSCIIDNLTGCSHFSIGTTVEYDEENRIWKVSKGYFPNNPGGLVVIEQDSGKIVKALLSK